MPVATAAVPAFAQRLLDASDEDRLALLQQTHPDHQAHRPSWDVLLDAFEGRGGFLTGDYLWPYPREADTEFNKRKAMARYHNYLETLVDLYVRFIFTQGVRRDSKNPEFNDWLGNVDGAGTGINDFLKRVAAMALVNGHAGVLVDKTDDEASGPTRADEQAQVIATIFTAAAIADWRHDGNKLTAVKLFEAAPSVGIAEPVVTGTDAQQYLLWDEEGWVRFNASGELLRGDTPDLGLVPLSVLRPKASHISAMLGRPLVSNANVVRALFNRASEEDQVLRDQAFSVLTVSVGPDGSVDDARTALGSVIGTAKALVVKGEIKYETPSQEVPGTIRDNMAYLVQELYRAAHVRFQRESLSAESGQAIRLQYTELNEMLQGFAKALMQLERDMARAWFAWQAATPEQAEADFLAAAPESTYPDEFFLDALMTDLEAWAEAIRMKLGKTMTIRIKKKAVRRIDADIPPDELKAIDAEIEALPTDEPSLTALLGTADTGDTEGTMMRRTFTRRPPPVPVVDEDADEED